MAVNFVNAPLVELMREEKVTKDSNFPKPYLLILKASIISHSTIKN